MFLVFAICPDISLPVLMLWQVRGRDLPSPASTCLFRPLPGDLLFVYSNEK
jgi:hypothetical protein